MKDNIINKTTLKSFLTILLYYFYSQIFIFILLALNINLEKLSDNTIIVISFIIDISLSVILYFIYRKDLNREFLIFKSNWKEFISKNFKYWYIGLIIMSLSNVLINLITSNEMAQNEAIVRGIVNNYPLYGCFSVIIIAPFVEEIIFRKTFKDVIKNKYILMAICGIAFGLIHVIETYKEITDLLYVIPYGVFGSVFAYMYYKTNTIFTSMFMHCFHNTLLLLLGFITALLGW